jgi:hypothetical protein
MDTNLTFQIDKSFERYSGTAIACRWPSGDMLGWPLQWIQRYHLKNDKADPLQTLEIIVADEQIRVRGTGLDQAVRALALGEAVFFNAMESRYRVLAQKGVPWIETIEIQKVENPAATLLDAANIAAGEAAEKLASGK